MKHFLCSVISFTQDVVLGLRELLAYEGNVEEDFLMHFEASVDEFGEVKTHILKEGGEQIAVTNENRQGI